MRFDPQIAAALVVTTCIGWMMLVAGLGKSGLELRRRRRICPACGREIQHRTCACSS
jgi:hypothetical protein